MDLDTAYLDLLIHRLKYQNYPNNGFYNYERMWREWVHNDKTIT